MIDCCDAIFVAESLAKSSSSKNAVPVIPVFITGLVKVLFVNVCVEVRRVIALVLLKSVLAIVIFAVPSNDTPAIVLAVANAVAVAELPDISLTTKSI